MPGACASVGERTEGCFARSGHSGTQAICFGAGKGAPLLASALLLLQCLLNLKQIEKLRYMHRNPVARGLVAKQEDWAWSSFRHYTTGLNGTVEIESFWTQRRREKGPSQVSEARPGAPRIE